MEYLATTPGDAIPSGAAVVVTRILGSDSVEVEATRAGSASSVAEDLKTEDRIPKGPAMFHLLCTVLSIPPCLVAGTLEALAGRDLRAGHHRPLVAGDAVGQTLPALSQ